MSIKPFSIALLTIGATALVGAAAADPTPAAPPPMPIAKTGPKVGDPDKPICKTTEVTGSRLGGKRVCMTKAQWEDQSRLARDGFKDYTNRGAQYSPSMGSAAPAGPTGH